MKKTAFLLVIACITVSCVESYYKPAVFLLNAQPFEAHNNYVDAYYSGDRFIQPQEYVKVAVILQKTDSPNIDRQISILKKVAQSNGADGILILGINDPGINTVKKYQLGDDILRILSQEKTFDCYTRTKENTITVLAVKYKKNLRNIDQQIKKVEVYSYNNKRREFEFEDSLLFNYGARYAADSPQKQHYQTLLSYSNDFLGVANKNEANATIKVEYNPNGTISRQEKTFSPKGSKEVSCYLYSKDKLTSKEITTADKKEYIEEYTMDDQNKIREVYIYKKNRSERIPLLKLRCVYLSVNDFSQIISDL